MSPKKLLARFLIIVALELLFLRHKFDLVEDEDYGNMGETFVYQFKAFRLYVINDRGDYYTQLSPDGLQLYGSYHSSLSIWARQGAGRVQDTRPFLPGEAVVVIE